MRIKPYYLTYSGVIIKKKMICFYGRQWGVKQTEQCLYVWEIVWQERIVLKLLTRGIFFNKRIQMIHLVATHYAELNTQLSHFKRTERNIIFDMDI